VAEYRQITSERPPLHPGVSPGPPLRHDSAQDPNRQGPLFLPGLLAAGSTGFLLEAATCNSSLSVQGFEAAFRASQGGAMRRRRPRLAARHIASSLIAVDKVGSGGSMRIDHGQNG